MTNPTGPKGPVVVDLMLSPKAPLIGLNIHNSGGGIGMDIRNGGAAGTRSVGAEVIVRPKPGQSAIGVSVVQSGPGIGLQVIQSGPGVGLSVIVGGD